MADVAPRAAAPDTEEAAADAVSGDPEALLQLVSASAAARAALTADPREAAAAAAAVAARVAAAREAAAGDAPASAAIGRSPSGVRLAPRDLDATALEALTLMAAEAAEDADDDASTAPGAAGALVVHPVANGADASAIVGISSSDPLVQRAALARYVAAESDARLRVSAAAGMRKVVAAMTEHLWVATVQEAGLIALRNLADKVDGRLPEVAAEGVRASVAALRAHSAVAGVQEAALAALRSLTRLADPAECFDEGIEAVVALSVAHLSNGPLQDIGFRTLSCLIGEDDTLRASDKAVASGAIEAAADALRTHPTSLGVHDRALAVLLTLLEPAASVDGAAASLKIRVPRAVQANLVPVAVATMRHFTHQARISDAGALLLRALAARDPDAAATAAAGGGIEATVGAMRTHRTSAELQEHAAAALRPLVASAAGKARASTAGALEAVSLALFAFPEDVGTQLTCLGALKSLAVAAEVRGRPAAGAAVEAAIAALNKHGVSRHILHAETEALMAAEACGALCNLTVGSAANGSRAATAGGVAAIAEAMGGEHVASVDVAEAGAAALWALAACGASDAATAVVTDGGIDSVVRAMNAHAAAHALQCVGAAALRDGAAATPAAAVAAAACGGVEALLGAMRLHGNSAALQEVCCDALSAILRATPVDVAKLAVLDGAAEVVQAALTTRFPKHMGVRRAATMLNTLLQPHIWGAKRERRRDLLPTTPPVLSACCAGLSQRGVQVLVARRAVRETLAVGAGAQTGPRAQPPSGPAWHATLRVATYAAMPPETDAPADVASPRHEHLTPDERAALEAAEAARARIAEARARVAEAKAKLAAAAEAAALQRAQVAPPEPAAAPVAPAVPAAEAAQAAAQAEEAEAGRAEAQLQARGAQPPLAASAAPGAAPPSPTPPDAPLAPPATPAAQPPRAEDAAQVAHAANAVDDAAAEGGAATPAGSPLPPAPSVALELLPSAVDVASAAVAKWHAAEAAAAAAGAAAAAAAAALARSPFTPAPPPAGAPDEADAEAVPSLFDSVAASVAAAFARYDDEPNAPHAAGADDVAAGAGPDGMLASLIPDDVAASAAAWLCGDTAEVRKAALDAGAEAAEQEAWLPAGVASLFGFSSPAASSLQAGPPAPAEAAATSSPRSKTASPVPAQVAAVLAARAARRAAAARDKQFQDAMAPALAGLALTSASEGSQQSDSGAPSPSSSRAASPAFTAVVTPAAVVPDEGVLGTPPRLAAVRTAGVPTDPDQLLLMLAVNNPASPASPLQSAADGSSARVVDSSGLSMTPRSMARASIDFRAQIPSPPPPARRALGEAALGSPPASPRVAAPTRPNAASLLNAPLPPRARTPQEAYALRMESKGWA